MSRNKLGGIIIACVILVIVVVAVVNRPPASPPGISPAGTYTLSVSVSPSGAGSVSPSSGSYGSGRRVTLIASPVGGYRFARWTGDIDTVANINAASTTITMHDNYSITANFEVATMAGPGQISAVSGELSPDWQKTAYWEEPYLSDLYVADPNGSNAKKVGSSRSGHRNASDGIFWSPTGKKIAFEDRKSLTKLDEETHLELVNVDGTGLTTLSRTGVVYLHWSPDESKIWFTVPGNLDRSFDIVPSDGSKPPKRVFKSDMEHFLAWAPTSDGFIVMEERITGFPDTRVVVSVSLRDFDWKVKETLFDDVLLPEITLWRPAGGVSGPYGIRRFSISPNLGKLVFTTVEEIFIIDMDGTNLIEAGVPRTGPHLAWSPDSKKIAYLVEEEFWVAGEARYATVKSIWVMNADGTHIKKVIEDVASLYGWSPDGRRIAYTTSANDGIYAVPVG